MRLAPSSGLLASIIVCGFAFGGCGDDSATPDSSNVPGESSNTGDTGGDTGVGGTSLPALTDPQMTPAPNPNAGGGGADADTTGSTP